MGIHGYMWIMVSAVLLTLQPCYSKTEKSLFCSVCRAVVDEVNARIDHTDPKKKVKVSSFRMGPDGNNRVLEKMYARSDEQLTEIFKDVCESMMDYGLQQLPGGKLSVFRTRSRSGEEIFNRNVGFNDNIRQTFKTYCLSLIDDHEDEMRSLFKLENLHAIESELCGRVANSCSEDDLTRPFSREEDKWDHRSNSFHDSDDDEDVQDVGVEDEDLENNIVEPATSKKKGTEDKKDEL